MDSNKDEALRCVDLAQESIASGDKDRALKFIKIAKRLNRDLSVNQLLAACEELDSQSIGSRSVNEGAKEDRSQRSKSDCGKLDDGMNGSRSYTDEHVRLIVQIRRNRDYYRILGVEKGCSGEEIKRAYKKLSLKVHPDKNKAPGAEEAFKKVCKAFKCLSQEESRRQYDLIGLVEESQLRDNYNVRQWRRRRRTVHDPFDDDFDTNEIFRSFFDRQDMFRTSNGHRSRGMHNPVREESHPGKLVMLLLLQSLPLLLIVLLACLPYFDPKYSLHKNSSYQIPKTTQKHGVEFFVKSGVFDHIFPLGSSSRANIEDNVFKDYKNMLWRYCHAELQRSHWAKNLPTPHCNKLHNLGLA